MRQVLVYADSLTWGIIPDTRGRLPFSARWPGVLESELLNANPIRVIEDCLNGRRTSSEDPMKPGRNGRIGIEQRIEVNSPLDLVILMLGTNDFQSMHRHTASDSAKGVASLVRAIREAPIEPGMPVPEVLIIAPPPIGTPRGAMAEKFEGGGTKCLGLAEALQKVATDEGCHFLDGGTVVTTSAIDGVHLDEDQHLRLGLEVARRVRKILTSAAVHP